eukprot:357715-Chlamydomonas_euryale.AAC.10
MPARPPASKRSGLRASVPKSELSAQERAVSAPPRPLRVRTQLLRCTQMTEGVGRALHRRPLARIARCRGVLAVLSYVYGGCCKGRVAGRRRA